MIEQDARRVIEDAGLVYLGLQERRTGDPGHVFNAPSGSTLMIIGDVTAEILTAKLKEHNAQFNCQKVSERK